MRVETRNEINLVLKDKLQEIESQFRDKNKEVIYKEEAKSRIKNIE